MMIVLRTVSIARSASIIVFLDNKNNAVVSITFLDSIIMLLFVYYFVLLLFLFYLFSCFRGPSVQRASLVIEKSCFESLQVREIRYALTCR